VNVAHHKVISKWHQRELQSCVDWHVSEYRIEHEQRLIFASQRRRKVWIAVGWFVLAVGIIAAPWVNF